MRILLLTQYFPPEKGAAQVRLGEIAKGFLKRGHTVTVVTAFPNYPDGVIPSHYQGKWWTKEEEGGLTIYRTWIFPVRRGRFWLRLLNYFSFVVSAFFGLTRCGEQDLIFVESPPLFLGFTAMVAGKMKKAPYIFNVADLWPESAVQLGLVDNRILINFCEKLEMRFYKNAYKLSAQTEGITESLRGKGFSAEDILFLPNGVDTELFQPRPADPALAAELGLSEGQRIILYAGTMGYVHGLETALAAADLLRSREDIFFLFVGDGSERPRLEEIAREKNLSNVRFLDFQPLEEIPRYYSISTLALSVLRRYGLAEGVRPSKVFPALASGKPLIYVGEGEGARLVAESGGGVVLKPEEPALLAETIEKLLADPQECRSMAESGRRYAQENFSWQEIVAAWFEQLMKGEKNADGY